MKFIHMADMHFDAPFVTLAQSDNLAIERRFEQRKAFKEIINYIKENKIDILLISGDLYEHQYIRKTTIDYINNLFNEIPETEVYITPGNHDPFINNSFYKQYTWAKNVHIFSNKLEVIEKENIDIYGYGFNDFYMKNPYENIDIKNKNKFNLLITHASLDGNNDDIRGYNSISTKMIKKMGFDYVALGHIHKNNISENNYNAVYPGSTVSLGFGELGQRGVVLGEIIDKKVNIKFLPICSRNFEEKEINISEINSEEELIEKINSHKIENQNFYKLIFVGTNNFEIKENEIMKLLENNNIIKIKNRTESKYDIKEIAKQDNLKGIFAKKILQKMDQVEENEKEKYLKAFQEGMKVLDDKR